MGATAVSQQHPPSSIISVNGAPSIKESQAQAAALGYTDATKASQKFTVYLFSLQAVRIGHDGKGVGGVQNAGKIEIGNVEVGGSLTPSVHYIGVDEYDPVKEEVVPAHEVDISNCITVTSKAEEKKGNTVIPERIVYKKSKCSRTDWEFELEAQHLGLDTADTRLTGIMKRLEDVNGQQEEVKYKWSGQWLTTNKMKTKAVTVIEEPQPVGLTGDLTTLKNLSPILESDDTSNARLKAGADGAQVRADELFIKILQNALDDETKKTFFRGSDHVAKLDDAATAVLNKNKDFCTEAAVHLMTGQLKGQKGLDTKLSDNIRDKRLEAFMAALNAQTPPKGKKDPWDDLGWSRKNDNDKEKAQKLDAQYKDVHMFCYEQGYKEQFPTVWTLFTKFPVYWFKIYAKWLKSAEHLEHWRTGLAAQAGNLDFGNQGDVSSQAKGNEAKLSVAAVHVRGWGDKLSLLKNAALQSSEWKVEGEKLDVKEVTEWLHGQCSASPAYHMIVDEEFERNIKDLFGKMDNTEPSKKFKEDIAKRSDFSHEVQKGLMQEAILLVSKLNNENSGLYKECQEYWRKCTPPGKKPGRLTVAQLIEALQEEEEIKDDKRRAAIRLERLKQLQVDNPGLDLMPPREPGPRRTFWERINLKGKLAGAWRTFRTLLHASALCVLGYGLSSGGPHDAIEQGRYIVALAAEGINVLGYFGRLLFDHLLTQRKIYKSALSWFHDALLTEEHMKSFGRRFGNALVGGVGKLVRLLGVVGCVFSLTSAYWDVRKAQESPESDTAFEIYADFQWVLAWSELIFTVGAIAAEVASNVALASCLGTLALGAGVLMLGVAVVYYIWFKPDPDADIKKFLNGPAKKAGDYIGE